MRIHSYPSIFNLGHKAVSLIFSEPVLVQEKVDGSQISFGMFPPEDPEKNFGFPELRIRSKSAEINVDDPDKLFRAGVEVIKSIQHLLVRGWTYRGEYLAKPKHNVLAYDRMPAGHIALFDIDRGDQDYLTHVGLEQEAIRLGLEVVPVLHHGAIESAEDVRKFLTQTSFLGGQKIEGVVIKNYVRFGVDKKVLMAKFVSEAFKEVAGGEWKKQNPSSGDVLDNLVRQYRTPARWEKAVHHLRDAGRLDDSPRDIGELFKEVPADIEKECADAIRDALYEHFWPKIRRGVCAGLAEWYKERLLEKQFEAPDAEVANLVAQVLP